MYWAVPQALAAPWSQVPGDMRGPYEPHQPGIVLGQGAGQAWKAAGASSDASVGMGMTGCGLALLWCGWGARPLQHHGERVTALGWAEMEPQAMEQGYGSPRKPG